MRRPAAVAAGIAAVAALCVAPRSAVAQERPAIEEVPGGIVRLLADYGRAFRTKDRDLLERTLGGALREPELRAFDNAREVPFRRYAVEAKTMYSGNFAYERIMGLYPGREVATYQVTERTALDVERVAYEEDGAFTFVRGGPAPGDAYDGWRLVSKSDAEALGFFSAHHLWDGGPVSVLRSERFVLLTHPDVVDEMRPVLDVAERAYDRAADFWPRRVDERYVIVVPTSTEELGKLIHATFDLGKFVAFVAAGTNLDTGYTPTGPRMLIHLSHLRNYNREGQLEIIAHELLHAFTRPLTGPHVPVWVEEGLANAGGGRGDRPSRARSGPVPDEFPTDERFLTGPVDQIVVRYDQSQVAIEVLIERFGKEALARFYERLGSARIVAGTDTYHVRRAIEDALDWTEQEWIAAWRERLS